MISVNDLRAGTTFEESGQLFQVLSFEHIKVGRGSANIKVKVRNIRSGAVVEKSYINTAKVSGIQVLKQEMQYLYKDDTSCYFMHPKTFEQVSVSLSLIPEHAFLKEGESYPVSFLGDESLSVLIPPKAVFAISETGPATKGNSATNVFKDAILENGIKTKVPLFVSVGDKIRVDTRTGAYTEKA